MLTTGWNFQDNNDDVSDVSDVGDGEQVGHGTHMAGIIAKVAPDARILPIKVLDSDGKTDTFMLAQGIYYAINSRVDVINLSIGSTYDARPVEEALQAARAVGIVGVAAAGNVAMHDPSWEFPALNDEVIGVVAGARQKCIDAGCDDYASKPIDRKTLIATIQEWQKRRPTPEKGRTALAAAYKTADVAVP